MESTVLRLRPAMLALVVAGELIILAWAEVPRFLGLGVLIGSLVAALLTYRSSSLIVTDHYVCKGFLGVRQSRSVDFADCRVSLERWSFGGRLPLPTGQLWIEGGSERSLSFSPTWWSGGWQAARRLRDDYLSVWEADEEMNGEP